MCHGFCVKISALCHEFCFIAPARSAGASYSETGVSNDQVSGVRCVRKSGDSPNGICIGHGAIYHSGYFSVDFQGAEENCVLRSKE